MKYTKPIVDSEADYTRLVAKVLIMLYLFAVLGLVVTWRMEGGPLWPTVVTAVIAAPLMLAAFLLGKPAGLRVFRKIRDDAERKQRRSASSRVAED